MDEAGDGVQCLTHCREHGVPNAILLDINMPEMNGWEFLNEIKSFVTPQNTTIYLLTSSINKLDKEKATHFPIINQYLSKPICKEILKKIKEENKL